MAVTNRVTIEAKQRLPIAAILIAAICFVVWSAIFIYGSSFIGIDGIRYFSLFDDAMISMRYGWNLSHGEGLVWNPGVYVEGYTSLLMTLLMSLATLLFEKRFAVLTIQVSGIILMLSIAFTTMKIAEHTGHGASQHRQTSVLILSFLAALLYYPLAYWTLMGMETGLLTLLLLSAVLFTFDYLKSQSHSKLLLLSVSLGFAYLTRPDSIVVAALIFVYLAYETYRSNSVKVALTVSAWTVGLCFIFILGQLMFRWFYYDQLLPNTYTLKVVGMPLFDKVRNGIGFIAPFLQSITVILLIGGTGLALNFSRQKLLLFSIPIALIGYQTVIGGDAWPYWRIVSPGLPLLLVLLVTAVPDSIVTIHSKMGAIKRTLFRSPHFERFFTIRLGGGLFHHLFLYQLLLVALGIMIIVFAFTADLIGIGARGIGTKNVALALFGTAIIFAPLYHRRLSSFLSNGPPEILVIGCLVIALVLANARFLSEAVFLNKPYQNANNQRNVNTAIALNHLTTEDATVGVFWAGTIPYYSDRVAIDFLGKSDRYIAALPSDLSGAIAWYGMHSVPGHNKYDLEYSIKHLQPTYVQDFSYGRQDLSEWAATKYTTIEYRGVNLHLLKDAQNILWN